MYEYVIHRGEFQPPKEVAGFKKNDLNWWQKYNYEEAQRSHRVKTKVEFKAYPDRKTLNDALMWLHTNNIKHKKLVNHTYYDKLDEKHVKTVTTSLVFENEEDMIVFKLKWF